MVSDALKTNLTMLGPLILPLSEQAKFLINYAQVRPRAGRRRRLGGRADVADHCGLRWRARRPPGSQRKILGRKDVKPYTPDFRKAVEHYCIHAGGRAVIDGLEQNLDLAPKHVLPSRATLNRVGNTYGARGVRARHAGLVLGR